MYTVSIANFNETNVASYDSKPAAFEYAQKVANSTRKCMYVSWLENGTNVVKFCPELSTEARELELFIDNDEPTYEYWKTCIRSLDRKMKRGKYSSTLAVKLWRHLADDAARRYCKEFGGTVRSVFPVSVRQELAEYIERNEADTLRMTNEYDWITDN